MPIPIDPMATGVAPPMGGPGAMGAMPQGVGGPIDPMKQDELAQKMQILSGMRQEPVLPNRKLATQAFIAGLQALTQAAQLDPTLAGPINDALPNLAKAFLQGALPSGPDIGFGGEIGGESYFDLDNLPPLPPIGADLTGPPIPGEGF